FHPLTAGTALGWVRPGASWPFEAYGAEGREISRDHFAIEDGQLIITTDRVPVMMTTNSVVAKQDCLCYLMHRRAWANDMEYD
ncbi:MAG: peptidase M14, partial [Myxococcota bacterium]